MRIIAGEVGTDTATGDVGSDWNCCTVTPTQNRAGDSGREGAGVALEQGNMQKYLARRLG